MTKIMTATAVVLLLALGGPARMLRAAASGPRRSSAVPAISSVARAGACSVPRPDVRPAITSSEEKMHREQRVWLGK